MSSLSAMDTPVVVNASGVLALLLQFAHPLVAAGLVSTGKFQEDSRLRLQHTAAAIDALMGDNPEVSKRFATKLAAVHARITGELTEDVGTWKAGTPYTASDPELVLWVYATLVISRVVTFEAFHQALSTDAKNSFYQSTYAFGEHFGIEPEKRPSSYDELVAYYHTTLDSLAVGSDGHVLVRSLLESLKPIYKIVRPVLTMLLPEQLRKQYNLPWRRRHQIQARIVAPLIVRMFPVVDCVLKLWYCLNWNLRRKPAKR